MESRTVSKIIPGSLMKNVITRAKSQKSAQLGEEMMITYQLKIFQISTNKYEVPTVGGIQPIYKTD